MTFSLPKQSIIWFLPMFALGCSTDPDPDEMLQTRAHLESSLPGSIFEIDDDANLIVDDPEESSLDWATVSEVRKQDEGLGQNDDSYQGGAKEDDECPNVSTGSIPKNKSDLETFGVWQEPGSPGFLHLFWTRVQDPSGTTLMDFEFNQSTVVCENGVNKERTDGDLLLEYQIDQGGASATILARFWLAEASAWGPAKELTDPDVNAATGTINETDILADDADGLGALDARTFGEASINLDFIFDEESCTSFGSAFLKSRSSDAFTSALKDFIDPIAINITNCGRVIIRKETDPDGMEEAFSFSTTLTTDPASVNTFELADGNSKEFTNVLFGYGIEVTEQESDTKLIAIDCSASSGVEPVTNLDERKVTFDIDADSDVVDCTFTNQAKGTIIIEKVSTDGMGTFSFDSSPVLLNGGMFDLTTTGAGVAGLASRTFSDLDPGTYSVSEDVPDGWNLALATCDDGSDPSSISLSAGETVKCTFTNERQRGAIKIIKTRSHAVDGAGPQPHAGVMFQVTGGELTQPETRTTDANGEACVDKLPLSAFVGDYAVTEILPSGYVPAGDLEKTVQVTEVAQCPDGDEVTFHNIPLTNITMSVDSQVPGGTSSTITCAPAAPVASNASTGDGSLTRTNLMPGNYTCTVVINP